MKEVVIVGIARTPIGSFGGSLAAVSAVELGVVAVTKAIERACVPKEQIQELFFGQVLQANAGQAPARQVALHSGLSQHTPCTTVNKVCASGMKAVILAAQAIAIGDRDCVVAGGMESMSNTPFYIPKARWGYKYGNGQLIDGVVRDGLQDPFDHEMMGMAGEHCAHKHNITREQQDDFAIQSYQRAQKATEEGYFAKTIAPVSIPQRKGEPIIIDRDDEVFKANFDKMRALKPAFTANGTITAANASKLNDGAAALVLMSADKAAELNLRPIAKIRSWADAAQEPIEFTTSPALALPKAVEKAKLKMDDIDYFEINEAFSCVTLINERLMHLDPQRVDVFGGAVALGHPIGCSGARIVVTLINVLDHKQGKLGGAAICNGGGGASAMVIERVY